MQLGRTTLEVSSIGLGTVEIGMPYGIGSQSLPTDEEAERLLRAAVEAGVTYFDTARGYGVAEERIGRSGISMMPGIVVGTKCAQFLSKEPNLQRRTLRRRIREEVDTSRRLLKRDQLQLVQLHIECPDFTNLEELAEIMLDLKGEGVIVHVGVATRGEAVPLAAMRHQVFETIQVAYSILDQRMAASVLPEAHTRAVGVINRSVLLKGALTQAAQHLPDSLIPLKVNAGRAAQVAANVRMDLPTLAIRFARSQPGVSTILIGTRKIQNLERAIRAAAQGSLEPETLAVLRTLAVADEQQVDPAQWPS